MESELDLMEVSTSSLRLLENPKINKRFRHIQTNEDSKSLIGLKLIPDLISE